MLRQLRRGVCDTGTRGSTRLGWCLRCAVWRVSSATEPARRAAPLAEPLPAYVSRSRRIRVGRVGAASRAEHSRTPRRGFVPLRAHFGPASCGALSRRPRSGESGVAAFRRGCERDGERRPEAAEGARAEPSAGLRRSKSRAERGASRTEQPSAERRSAEPENYERNGREGKVTHFAHGKSMNGWLAAAGLARLLPAWLGST